VLLKEFWAAGEEEKAEVCICSNGQQEKRVLRMICDTQGSAAAHPKTQILSHTNAFIILLS